MVATVIGTTGSTPASALSRMLVTNSGRGLRGTVGGGSMEAEVVQKAAGLAGTGKAAFLTFHLREDELVQGLICGGDLEILIEPMSRTLVPMLEKIVRQREAGEDGILLTLVDNNGTVTGKGFFDASAVDESSELQKQWNGPKLEWGYALNEELRKALRRDVPRTVETAQGKLVLEFIKGTPGLIVLGGGHVSRSLCKVAAMAGFRVTVVDDREAYANQVRFAEASQTIVTDFVNAFTHVAVKQSTSIVIVTRSHHFDEILLEKALRTPAGYIGMIGSKQKVRSTFSHLIGRGADPAHLARVHAPIGIEIGAVTPEEIAVSIVAELVAFRREKQGAFRSKSDNNQLSPPNSLETGTTGRSQRFTN